MELVAHVVIRRKKKLPVGGEKTKPIVFIGGMDLMTRREVGDGPSCYKNTPCESRKDCQEK